MRPKHISILPSQWLWAEFLSLPADMLLPSFLSTLFLCSPRDEGFRSLHPGPEHPHHRDKGREGWLVQWAWDTHTPINSLCSCALTPGDRLGCRLLQNWQGMTGTHVFFMKNICMHRNWYMSKKNICISANTHVTGNFLGRHTRNH